MSFPNDQSPYLCALLAAIAFVRHRHRLDPDEAEDFESIARLKLLENEKEILRKFRGECRLETFLATVVQRLFLDHRDKRWGKWRSSSAARRLGSDALLIEVLIHREGRSRDEAVEIVLARGDCSASRTELVRICDAIPDRSHLRFVGIEELETMPAAHGAADSRAESVERAAEARRVASALRTLIETLEARDRLALRLHFVEGLNLSLVARTLGVDIQWLHRRVKRLLEALKASLEGQNIHGQDVAALIGREDVDLVLFDFMAASAKKSRLRPSNERKETA